MNTDTSFGATSRGSLQALLLRSLVVLGLAGATYAVCRSTPQVNIPSEAGLALNLPSRVGNFTGEDQPVSESEKLLLPGDTQFAKKLYRNAEGAQVNCQIVLSGGEKRSIHRPEICLPGQGWTKKSGEVLSVKLDNGRKLDVMKLTIARLVEVRPGVRKELTNLFVYWFVGKNLTTPYHWYRILHTDLDRVLHNVNHRWAYVIVSAPVLEGFTPGGKDQTQTLAMIEKFIAEVAPQIMKADSAGTASEPAPPPDR